MNSKTKNDFKLQSVESVEIKEEPCYLDSDQEFDRQCNETVSDEELLKFGDNLLSKMKYLSEIDNVKLMLEIQELVTQTRLKYMMTKEQDRSCFVNVEFQ